MRRSLASLLSCIVLATSAIAQPENGKTTIASESEVPSKMDELLGNPSQKEILTTQFQGEHDIKPEKNYLIGAYNLSTYLDQPKRYYRGGSFMKNFMTEGQKYFEKEYPELQLTYHDQLIPISEYQQELMSSDSDYVEMDGDLAVIAIKALRRSSQIVDDTYITARKVADSARLSFDNFELGIFIENDLDPGPFVRYKADSFAVEGRSHVDNGDFQDVELNTWINLPTHDWRRVGVKASWDSESTGGFDNKRASDANLVEQEETKVIIYYQSHGLY